MKCIVLAGYLLFFALNFSYAQIDPEESREHIILKWSPLSMFDLDNTVQIGAEIPLKDDRFTIQQDVGFGHSSFNIWYSDQENRPDKRTIKARTQFRYYFYEKPRFRSYVAGEFLYKRVVNREVRWVGMDCSTTGGCSYFENKRVSREDLSMRCMQKSAGSFTFPTVRLWIYLPDSG